jgi:hypothetical protein
MEDQNELSSPSDQPAPPLPAPSSESNVAVRSAPAYIGKSPSTASNGSIGSLPSGFSEGNSEGPKRRKSLIERNKEEVLNQDAFFRAQREEANVYGAERDSLLDQSQIAWDCNDKEAAKELSDKAKEQHALFLEANKNAADVIFRTNNNRCKSDEISLYGLYPDEAVDRLYQKLDKDLASGASKLVIIVGHSDEAEDEKSQSLGTTLNNDVRKALRRRGFPYRMDNPKFNTITVTYNGDLDVSNSTADGGQTADPVKPPAPCCTIS